MANLNNGAYSTLASGITAGATSLSVASGEGARFPSSNFYISVYDSRYPNWAVAYRAGAGEIMLCSSRSTDALTVTRAQGGTSAVAFNTTGVTYRVENNLVAENLSGLSTEYVDLTTAQNINGLKEFQDGLVVGESSVTDGFVRWKDSNGANVVDVYIATGGASTTRTQYLQNDDGTVGLTKNIKALLVFGGPVGPSITRYAVHGAGDATVRTNEYEAQIPVGAGVIKNLRVWICANAGVNNYVVTVRKNGSDQTLTVSCNSNSTTGTLNSDTTNSFTTASGDLISVKIVTGANGGFTPAFVYYTMELCGA